MNIEGATRDGSIEHQSVSSEMLDGLISEPLNEPDTYAVVDSSLTLRIAGDRNVAMQGDRLDPVADALTAARAERLRGDETAYSIFLMRHVGEVGAGVLQLGSRCRLLSV